MHTRSISLPKKTNARRTSGIYIRAFLIKREEEENNKISLNINKNKKRNNEKKNNIKINILPKEKMKEVNKQKLIILNKKQRMENKLKIF